MTIQDPSPSDASQPKHSVQIASPDLNPNLHSNHHHHRTWPSPISSTTITKFNWSKHIAPLLILLTIVLASAAQTEFASYITSTDGYGYDKPYFQFWLTHVTFAFVFPMHLAVLWVLEVLGMGVGARAGSSRGDGRGRGEGDGRRGGRTEDGWSGDEDGARGVGRREGSAGAAGTIRNHLNGLRGVIAIQLGFAQSQTASPYSPISTSHHRIHQLTNTNPPHPLASP